MIRIFSLPAALLMTALLSSTVKCDELDDFIKAQMQKRHIPGLSMAILQDGKIVKAKGYGVTAKGGTRSVTPSTLFQAGSISKSVAALGALHLVEQGKLALDEDVNTKLTSWKVPDNEFTREKKVTLRGILSHSAGLTVHGFPGYAIDAPMPTLVQVLDGEKPANTPAIRVDILPGSLWRYSGGGYTIMQQMVLDVTGKSFPEFMQETVLTPLGMTASTYQQPLPPDKAEMTATGHYADRSLVQGRWHVYPEMAAAGLWTTPSDLLHFAIGVQQSLAGSSNPVISQTMTRQMLTNQKDNDGLGVFLDGSGKTLRFSHNGRDEGFDALLVAYSETGQGAAIMINANDNTRMVSRILEAIAREYHWPDYPIYTRPQHSAVKIAAKALDAYTGRYELNPNFMLTFVRANGRLFTQTDGAMDEEFVPESETQFVSTERDAQITFVKAADGTVTGFSWKENGQERKVPRIGPLIRAFKPQSDPDPTVTKRAEEVLKALAQGGQPEAEVAGITPGARKDFSPGPMAELAGMQSISFISAQDVADRGIERHDGKVGRICYYKLVTDKVSHFVLVYWTSEGLVTDFDVVDD